MTMHGSLNRFISRAPEELECHVISMDLFFSSFPHHWQNRRILTTRRSVDMRENYVIQLQSAFFLGLSFCVVWLHLNTKRNRFGKRFSVNSLVCAQSSRIQTRINWLEMVGLVILDGVGMTWSINTSNWLTACEKQPAAKRIYISHRVAKPTMNFLFRILNLDVDHRSRCSCSCSFGIKFYSIFFFRWVIRVVYSECSIYTTDIIMVSADKGCFVNWHIVARSCHTIATVYDFSVDKYKRAFYSDQWFLFLLINAKQIDDFAMTSTLNSI